MLAPVAASPALKDQLSGDQKHNGSIEAKVEDVDAGAQIQEKDTAEKDTADENTAGNPDKAEVVGNDDLANATPQVAEEAPALVCMHNQLVQLAKSRQMHGMGTGNCCFVLISHCQFSLNFGANTKR